jgi:hypothetical protein
MEPHIKILYTMAGSLVLLSLFLCYMLLGFHILLYLMCHFTAQEVIHAEFICLLPERGH